MEFLSKKKIKKLDSSQLAIELEKAKAALSLGEEINNSLWDKEQKNYSEYILRRDTLGAERLQNGRKNKEVRDYIELLTDQEEEETNV